MINKINVILRIICCDLSMILSCINWDQKCRLFTRIVFDRSCYWDNYRLITEKIYFYPHADEDI
ncbi:hypothetical protein CSW98_16180 [Vibrio sp. HA2012]|nr:hypothetical protein CSW98_16180 [Vibrio sp. HA2012]